MSLNFLNLNPDQTEIILIGPASFATTVYQFIGPFHLYINSTAKIFDIIFDQHMTFDHHLTKLVQSCYLQFRNIEIM